MERMTKIDENMLAARKLLTEMVERCYKTEDENKKLKEEIDKLRVLKCVAPTNAIRIDKENEELKLENEKLKTRIDTMQEFIDYSEGVVQNAVRMVDYEGGAEDAIKYLEECYVIGDDEMYEAMERADEEDSDLFD